MPAPNLTAAPPVETGLVILDAPKQNRPVNIVQHNDNMSDDTLFRGTSSEIKIQGLDYSLNPNGSYRAELHSEPVNLGSLTSDLNSNLSGQIQIPNDTPIGFHTLHFYGINLAGENLDIYKEVYIAADEDDYDGDGIDNNTDPCFFIEPSGQDYDQDGIDDACDGAIDQPPPPEPLPEQGDTTDDNEVAVTETSTNTQDQNPVVVLSSSTDGGTQPPVANTEVTSSVDVFSPENDDKDVIPQIQSATTANVPVTTRQDNNKFGLDFSILKQQWPLLTAVSITAVALLSLIWKKAFLTQKLS